MEKAYARAIDGDNLKSVVGMGAGLNCDSHMREERKSNQVTANTVPPLGKGTSSSSIVIVNRNHHTGIQSQMCHTAPDKLMTFDLFIPATHQESRDGLSG